MPIMHRAGLHKGNALTAREREILRLVVQRFIHTAAPVGSTTLSKEPELNLSSASIRNTMSSLEARGYLDHPHTSAGRVPTQQGYRTYVDELMDVAGLTKEEAALLRAGVERRLGDLDVAARETSRLLGRLTHLLGVVLTPSLATGVLERLDIVPLSSTRVMFVIAVRSGLARTVIAELDGEVPARGLDTIVQRLNERLAGLTLDEIRKTGAGRVKDLGPTDPTGIVRVVLRDSSFLFSEADEASRTTIAGTQHLLSQPEFQEPEEIRNVIELAESEDVVVHLLESPAMFDPQHPEQAVVFIGRDFGREKTSTTSFSIVKAHYFYGNATGTVGVIGPTRMDYPRAVALVEHVARLLDHTDET